MQICTLFFGFSLVFSSRLPTVRNGWCGSKFSCITGHLLADWALSAWTVGLDIFCIVWSDVLKGQDSFESELIGHVEELSTIKLSRFILSKKQWRDLAIIVFTTKTQLKFKPLIGQQHIFMSSSRPVKVLVVTSFFAVAAVAFVHYDQKRDKQVWSIFFIFILWYIFPFISGLYRECMRVFWGIWSVTD